MMLRKTLLRLSLLALPFVVLALYYWSYQRYSRNLIYREHVYYEKANGLKHALAAAHLTELFRHILSDEDTEQLVLWLGTTNEYMEQVICRPRDSTAEVLKDMSNNQVGITVALWLRHHPSDLSTAQFIIQVTKEHVLLESAQEVKLSPDDAALTFWASVDAAQRRLIEDRPAIIARTTKAIETAFHPKD